MYRGAGRKDENQPEIEAALKAYGASIIDASRVGGGFPDLIVGWRGANILMEVKNPKGQYGRAGLNKNQRAWVAKWTGPTVFVVRSVEEAIAALEAGWKEQSKSVSRWLEWKASNKEVVE